MNKIITWSWNRKPLFLQKKEWFGVEFQCVKVAYWFYGLSGCFYFWEKV